MMEFTIELTDWETNLSGPLGEAETKTALSSGGRFSPHVRDNISIAGPFPQSREEHSPIAMGVEPVVRPLLVPYSL